MPSSPDTTPPRASIRLAAILFSVTITLLGLEVVLRIAPGLVPAKMLLHFSPDLRTELARGRFVTRDQVRLLARDDDGPNLWIMKPYGEKFYDFPDPRVPDSVQADDIGFCNPEGLYKETDRFDIMTVGDSFTACHAVSIEDAWSLQLGVHLDSNVYNLGNSGVGVYEYNQILKTFAVPKKPRVVVMNFYEGNDLRDAMRYLAGVSGAVTEMDAVTQSMDDTAAWKTTWLGKTSYAFNFLCALPARLRQLYERRSEESGIDFHYKIRFGDDAIEMNPANQDIIEILNGRRLAAGELSTDILDDGFDAFMELAREHGFKPVVLYSPSAHTAYGPNVEYADPSVEPDVAHLSKVQRDYLAELSKKLGFDYIDLTPALAEAAKKYQGDLLFDPLTLHYTPLGHEFVGRYVSERLIELGIAKPAA